MLCSYLYPQDGVVEPLRPAAPERKTSTSSSVPSSVPGSIDGEERDPSGSSQTSLEHSHSGSGESELAASDAIARTLVERDEEEDFKSGRTLLQAGQDDVGGRRSAASRERRRRWEVGPTWRLIACPTRLSSFARADSCHRQTTTIF